MSPLNDFNAFLGRRRCKNWSPKIFSWKYLTIWRPALPFFPEHWNERLISALHPELLYQRVLKVSSCSSSWFNPCRQRWQVPICSWHLLKLDSARMDTEGQGQGLVKKRTQRSMIKVWSRRESLSRDVCLWPLPSMPKDLTSKQGCSGGFLYRCPLNRKELFHWPSIPAPPAQLSDHKDLLGKLSFPSFPSPCAKTRAEVKTLPGPPFMFLISDSCVVHGWHQDPWNLGVGDWWETERRWLSFLIVSLPPVIVSSLLNTLQFQSSNIGQRRKALRNLNLTYSPCSFESLPDLFLLLLFLARLHGVWVLSFPTRDWTQVTPVKGQDPNHWTTREFPRSTSLYMRLDSLLCTQDDCVIDTYQWDEAFPPYCSVSSYCV